MSNATCGVPECERPALARSLCNGHYKRWQAGKDLGGPIRPTRLGLACSGPDCERPAKSKGLCNMHYERLRVYGHLADTERRAGCVVDGCTRPHRARGWCGMHWSRWKANGDPLLTSWERNPDAPPTCTMKGCDRPHKARGLCERHVLALRRSEDPERYRAHSARRRQRVRLNGTRDESEDLIEYRRLLAGDPCVYCGKPMEAIDHIAPLARGGADRCDNLAAVCASCNSSKGARGVLQFLLDRLGGGVDAGRVRSNAAPGAA